MGRETREFDAPEVLDGTIVLQLGYDGTGYSGFAEQPGQTTVAARSVARWRPFCVAQSS